ncbi:hypothetical protein [Billgrantia antri]|uniref:Uncharacterized protein n=1 Tax=Billgrantia antri TaxID=2846777 RepID=A0ABS6ZMN2_9GAMM|nr:hypothetical protein [Halomonas antri]MBW6390184.1 hypothetical protein [Halomonas antri]
MSGIDVVAVGHTIVLEAVILGNVYYPDPSAFDTGRLKLLQARELVA